MTELKDTVDIMLSNDYKERFRAEYYQVEIRRDKLSQMVKKWDNGQLDFTPNCPKEILLGQLAAMYLYSEVLKKRARIENIVL